MNTLFTGQHLIRLASVPSTNTWAMRLLPDNPPEGTVIWADEQTEGKGRNGNRWYADAGKALTMSVIYYPRLLQTNQIFYLSKITSLAVYKLISSLLPDAPIHIKWPNDILLDRKKIAGILIENQISGKHVKASVIGIGLNINQQIFHKDFSYEATSLYMYNDRDYDTEDVLAPLLVDLEQMYMKLRQGRHIEIDEMYQDALYGFGEEISIRVRGADMRATITGVDARGRLGIMQADTTEYLDIDEVKIVLTSE